jgi:hypothetical protein
VTPEPAQGGKARQEGQGVKTQEGHAGAPCRGVWARVIIVNLLADFGAGCSKPFRSMDSRRGVSAREWHATRVRGSVELSLRSTPIQTEPGGASMASCAGRRIGGELRAKLRYNGASARVAASAGGAGSVSEHAGQGRGWPRATLSFYTIIDCHSLRDLHSNLAVTAVICCQNDSVAPG